MSWVLIIIVSLATTPVTVDFASGDRCERAAHALQDRFGPAIFAECFVK